LDCEIRQLGNRKWKRCVRKTAPKKIEAARVVKKFKRGLQECTVTKRGAINHTTCVWTDIMKDAKIVKKFKDGRDRCVVWRSPKAVRKVCEPIGQSIVKKFKNKAGHNCTVFRNGPDSWTRCIAPGTTNKLLKRFVRNGKECAQYQRGQKKFIRCSNRPMSLKGAVVIGRWNKDGKICTRYKRGLERFTKCVAKKTTQGRIIRIWMRQGQKCTTYTRGLRQWTRCQWLGNWQGARVERRFQKGKNTQCTVWTKDLKFRTVCWNNE